MTTFATVGIERIQAVLARSRHLWGRRGASEELVQLTTLPHKAESTGMSTIKLAVQRALDSQNKQGGMPTVEITPEALDLDGVVNFQSQSEEHALAVARHLAFQIRRALPSTQVRVSWVTIKNGTYFDALARSLPDSGHPWCSETYYPAANEIPFVRACDECGQSPASDTSENQNRDPGQPTNLRLCRDCFKRSNPSLVWSKDRRSHNITKASGTRNRVTRNPSRFAAEHWLIDTINDRNLERVISDPVKASPHDGNSSTIHGPLTGVSNFNELAAMVRPRREGERRRTHTDNHTAMFFADGNGLGALFKKAQEKAVADKDMTEYSRLSTAIKEATENALVEATESILMEGDETLPAIPHILGGDDLLVTLPADRAWGFITTFFTTMEEELDQLDLDSGTTRPTVSAGVLFCKAEFPFGDQIEIAESLLRKAKQHVKGSDWSIAWTDITLDGLDGAHDPITLAQLNEWRTALDYTRSKLPASAEAELLSAMNDPDIRVAQQKVGHRIARIEGAREFLDACGVDHKNLTPDNVQLVNDITAMGRWWR